MASLFEYRVLDLMVRFECSRFDATRAFHHNTQLVKA